jgi:hypothetical protein
MNVDATAPQCPECGYDLRGIPQERCPECGFGFDYAAIRSLAEIYAEEQRFAYRRAVLLALIGAFFFLLSFANRFISAHSDYVGEFVLGLAGFVLIVLLATIVGSAMSGKAQNQTFYESLMAVLGQAWSSRHAFALGFCALLLAALFTGLSLLGGLISLTVAWLGLFRAPTGQPHIEAACAPALKRSMRRWRVLTWVVLPAVTLLAIGSTASFLV